MLSSESDFLTIPPYSHLGALTWKKMVKAMAVYAHVNRTPERRLGNPNFFLDSSRSKIIAQPKEPIIEKCALVKK